MLRKQYLFILVSLIMLVTFLSGCIGGQFGSPSATKGDTVIKGRVVMPENNCYTGACDNPAITEGEPLPNANVILVGSSGKNLYTTTDCKGEYSISGAEDSCYILYANIQDTEMWVKKGIYPVEQDKINDAGEANYYTTAQVIIYEVAKQLFGDAVTCDIIGDLIPTEALLDAVKEALVDCRDAQQDGDVRKLATLVAKSIFGSPSGGGGGGGTTIIVGPTPTINPSPTPTTLYKITGTVYMRNEEGQMVPYDNSKGPIGLRLVKKVDSSKIEDIFTQDNGTFEFSPVPAGEYVIEVISVPEGFDITVLPKSKAATKAKATSDTVIEVVIVNADSPGNNFLLEPVKPETYKIQGRVLDKETDKGVNGVVVSLYKKDGTTLLKSVSTGPNGGFSFTRKAGKYVIKVDTYDTSVYTGGVDPEQRLVEVVNSDVAGQVFYLLKNPVYSIQGQVVVKGTTTGINGAKVTLYNTNWDTLANDTSEGNGQYRFENLVAGTYYLKVNQYPEAYKAVEPEVRTVNIVSDNITGQKFELVPQDAKTYFVDGHVFKDKGSKNGVYDDGEGVAGIEVKLSIITKTKASVEWNKTTDANGYYKFTGLEDGVEYKVKPVIKNTPYEDVIPNNYQFTINGSNVRDKDFQLKNTPAEKTYCISGYTYKNGTTNPVKNVTVKLFDDATDTLMANTTSDADGFYQFCNLTDKKTYRIKAIVPSGYTDVNPNKRILQINGADVTDAHFWFVKASDPVYTLTGVVYASDEKCDEPCYDCDRSKSKSLIPVAGIKVVLRKYITSNNSWEKVDEVTTDGSGIYTFANKTAGKYRITVPVPQGGYPYVNPEKYENEITILKDSNLDFTLNCCQGDPCCEVPKIKKLTLQGGCSDPIPQFFGNLNVTFGNIPGINGMGDLNGILCPSCSREFCLCWMIGNLEMKQGNNLEYKFEAFFIPESGPQFGPYTIGSGMDTDFLLKNMPIKSGKTLTVRIKATAWNSCGSDSITQEIQLGCQGEEPGPPGPECCEFTIQNHHANWGANNEKGKPGGGNNKWWGIHFSWKLSNDAKDCEEERKIIFTVYDKEDNEMDTFEYDVPMDNKTHNVWEGEVFKGNNHPNGWKYTVQIKATDDCPAIPEGNLQKHDIKNQNQGANF